MREFNPQRQIWLTLDLDNFIDDLELSPLPINKIMSASLIEFLLPKV